MVRALLNLEKVPKPDDTADALAVAICHANSSLGGSRYRQAVEKALRAEKAAKDRKDRKKGDDFRIIRND